MFGHKNRQLNHKLRLVLQDSHMSEPIDITVRTEADYRRNAAMANATEVRILKQAYDEAWPIERRNEALVEALLPYYRANTDPASPAANEALLNEYLQEQGDDAEILDTEKNATLYATLAQQTRTLNAVHGVNYPPPPIILVNGLKDDKHTPLKFENDAVLIDRAFFEQHANDPNLASAIAHELGHRYQRSEEKLRLYIKINELGIKPSEHDYALNRSLEAAADFDARRVSAPGAFSNFLKDALRSDAVALGQYMATNPSLTKENAVESWNSLTTEKQEQLKKEAEALPAAMKESYFTRGIEAIDAVNDNPEHPKLQDRFALQDALNRNPVVLSCRNIQFDGDTHIIEATNCGPRNVPLIVDGLPTGNRVRQ